MTNTFPRKNGFEQMPAFRRAVPKPTPVVAANKAMVYLPRTVSYHREIGMSALDAHMT
jgi:hypothetical protein